MDIYREVGVVEGHENELSVILTDNAIQSIPLGFTPEGTNVYLQLLKQHQTNYPENIHVSVQPAFKLSTEHTTGIPYGNVTQIAFKLNGNEVEIHGGDQRETVVFRVWETKQ